VSQFFADATIYKIIKPGTPQVSFEVMKFKQLDDFIKPVVNAMATVLFFDPFAAVGLHDPVVYDADGVPSIDKSGKLRTRDIPFIVIWLVFGAIFFTIKTKFINFRGFGHAIALVTGKYDDPSETGQVSHFQALATALSATVGLGNIAGVAIAISLGGPGATLWMIIAGLLGMASKFMECTLGVKYRTVDKQGEVSGGPMYFLSRGLEKRGMAGFGKILAGLFAVLCIGASFGGGNMFQANQAFAQLKTQFPVFNGFEVFFGIMLAILVGIVIIGGIKSIASTTEKIVPFMAVLYVSVSLVILFSYFSEIDDAFVLIFNGAFNPGALLGGVVGVLVVGFQRAAFSNEAGIGSASIAHSAVKTDKPVTEGIVALLEPFIDTVIICTMTALVIIITGYHDNAYGYGGAPLTSAAFGSVFSWFPLLLMIAIILFAFSTMISWSYYGLKAWTYLFGGSKGSELTYKSIFLIFVVIGSTIKLGAILDFSDMMILTMAFPNIIGLIIMSGEVKKDLNDYLADLKAKIASRKK
jgi:AGCS family alanine or glycine:cation symporter